MCLEAPESVNHKIISPRIALLMTICGRHIIILIIWFFQDIPTISFKLRCLRQCSQYHTSFLPPTVLVSAGILSNNLSAHILRSPTQQLDQSHFHPSNRNRRQIREQITATPFRSTKKCDPSPPSLSSSPCARGLACHWPAPSPLYPSLTSGIRGPIYHPLPSPSSAFFFSMHA